MTVTKEIRDAIPEPLYSCHKPSCAEERSRPAAELRWFGDGFYCRTCIDEMQYQAQQAGEILEDAPGNPLSETLKTHPQAIYVPEDIYRCADESGECYCWPPDNLTYWRGGFYCEECITAEAGGDPSISEEAYDTRFDGPTLAEVLAER